MAASEEFKNELIKRIPDMRRFARAKLRDRQECDDIVHDTLVKAMDLCDSFKPGTNMKAWLFTIEMGLINNAQRRQGSRNKYLEEHKNDSEAQLPEQFEYLVMEEARSLIRNLHPDQRAALYLVCHEGRSYQEAAEILEVSVGTVKSRVSRGRVELAEALKDSGTSNKNPPAPAAPM